MSHVTPQVLGLGVFFKVGAASVALMVAVGALENGCFHNSSGGSYVDGVGGGGGAGGFCAVFGCMGDGGGPAGVRRGNGGSMPDGGPIGTLGGAGGA